MSKPLTLHFEQVDGLKDWRERTSLEGPIPGVGDLVYYERCLYRVVGRFWYFTQPDSANAKHDDWSPVVYFKVQKVTEADDMEQTRALSTKQTQ